MSAIASNEAKTIHRWDGCGGA